MLLGPCWLIFDFRMNYLFLKAWFIDFYYFMCILHNCMYVCASCVCLGPSESRRVAGTRVQKVVSPWRWVLGTEPGPSGMIQVMEKCENLTLLSLKMEITSRGMQATLGWKRLEAGWGDDSMESSCQANMKT